MPVDTFVGVVLIQANHELFPAYADTGRTWGPSLLNDLHTGGAIMWVGGDAIMFVLLLCVSVAFLRDKRAQATMGDWLEGARLQALHDTVGTARDRRRRHGRTGAGRPSTTMSTSPLTTPTSRGSPNRSSSRRCPATTPIARHEKAVTRWLIVAATAVAARDRRAAAPRSIRLRRRSVRWSTSPCRPRSRTSR